MSDSICRRIIVSGRVQGVGFRFFVVDEAKRLGLRGWVSNLPDGRVQAEVQGPEAAVDEIVDRLYVGPTSAHVTDVVVEPGEGDADFQGFRIR